MFSTYFTQISPVNSLPLRSVHLTLPNAKAGPDHYQHIGGKKASTDPEQHINLYRKREINPGCRSRVIRSSATLPPQIQFNANFVSSVVSGYGNHHHFVSRVSQLPRQHKNVFLPSGSMLCDTEHRKRRKHPVLP